LGTWYNWPFYDGDVVWVRIAATVVMAREVAIPFGACDGDGRRTHWAAHCLVHYLLRGDLMPISVYNGVCLFVCIR